MTLGTGIEPLRTLDLFSGIGGFALGLERTGGFRTVAFAEIDKFPCAVLAHRFPGIPNLGDVARADADAIGPVDVVCGGSPCQSFSVAGKRAGLDDPRGNLALVMLALVGRVRPRWVVYENVPGLLSIDGGRTFGTFLGLLGELGYGFAYRVLDAQHFGVPQRRRRLFVVGCLGDWRPAAAVLFERHSLSGNPPPRREAGQGVAGTLAGISPGGGWRVGSDEAAAGQLVANAITARQQKGPDSDATTTLVFQCHGSNVGEMGTLRAGNGFHTGGTPFIAGHFEQNSMAGRGTLGWNEGDAPLRPVKPQGDHQFIVFDTSQITHPANRSACRPGDPSPTLAKDGHVPSLAGATAVRRLTPRECERLQGFPDDWTLVSYRGKPAADGPRYKALGNSVAVPVISWIGSRILEAQAIPSEQRVGKVA